MPSIPLLDLLYQALNAERGIVVSSPEVLRLRQRLYTARKQAKDPDLDILTISLSPANPETELMVVRKDAKS